MTEKVKVRFLSSPLPSFGIYIKTGDVLISKPDVAVSLAKKGRVEIVSDDTPLTQNIEVVSGRPVARAD